VKYLNIIIFYFEKQFIWLNKVINPDIIIKLQKFNFLVALHFYSTPDNKQKATSPDVAFT